MPVLAHYILQSQTQWMFFVFSYESKAVYIVIQVATLKFNCTFEWWFS